MDLDFFQHHDIYAFIPEYHGGVGEVTRVTVAESEDYIMPVTMKTFRVNLCRFYSIDYAVYRRKYGGIIGSTNCIPLTVSSNKVFLQLKVRTPKFKNDSAMGYVDLNSIAQLKKQDDKYRTEITFKDGRKLKVLCGIGTVNRHIKNAKLVLDHYRNEKGFGAYPEILEKLYTNLDKPATKADIVILASEILTLKNSLKEHRNGV